MIIERVLNPEWVSNSYLVGDEPGGTGIVIDTSGPSQSLFEAAEEHDLTVTHLLLTHHHADHVAENHLFKERYGVEIMAHPLEAARLLDVDTTIEPDEELTIGGLEIKAIHTPGHTDGMLNFLINGSEIFTGDTLFKGSVGGVKAPGSTTFEDMKHSIMEVLMKLPHDVSVRPGHMDPTTLGDEWENNEFIRVWRGLEPESNEHCTVWDKGATLVLFAPDYDGGHKAWVRWDESGADDIVPGSQVVRA